MYIELYYLDNLLMNALLLRLAACVCGLRVVAWRLWLVAAFGAAVALGGLYSPAFVSLPAKVLLLMVMALGVPTHTLRGYLYALFAVLLSTCFVGGMMYALLLIGGSVIEAVPWRVMLYALSIAAVLPNIWRRMRSQRHLHETSLLVEIEHSGVRCRLCGMIDTGNTLTEPLTALPGVVVYAPELVQFAKVPTLSCAANGKSALLYGFLPESVRVGGVCVDAFVFVLKEAQHGFGGGEFQALVPPSVLPVEYLWRTDGGFSTEQSNYTEIPTGVN